MTSSIDFIPQYLAKELDVFSPTNGHCPVRLRAVVMDVDGNAEFALIWVNSDMLDNNGVMKRVGRV
jgi:hypothetical protein